MDERAAKREVVKREENPFKLKRKEIVDAHQKHITPNAAHSNAT